jgi:hypothetical protein
MSQKRSPGRERYPLSLAPLTPEEALRRAMSVAPPTEDPLPPKQSAKPATRKAAPKKSTGKA